MKVGDLVRIDPRWAHMFTTTGLGIIVETVRPPRVGYRILWSNASIGGYQGEELELIREGGLNIDHARGRKSPSYVIEL